MLQPRQRLGDFEIIRLLGRGGMGEVYEARQTNPERRVALKVLAPWLAQDDDALKRFWREAEVPAKLDHPGVVRIIATGKTEEIAYYAMQLVRGISLGELMRRAKEPLPETVSHRADTSRPEAPTTPYGERTPLSAEAEVPPVVHEYHADRYTTTAKIGIQAARALASAHKQGYLHRDIKPSNLMMDHHNQLYLVDFGLTRALASGPGTRAGMVVGTPYYMSPEQAHGHPLDPRSDIYSLGVTLYQLATRGEGPYQSHRDDSDAVLREVRSGTVQPLRRLAPDIPADLERIILKAITSAPDQRYQTAEELARALELFVNPVGSRPSRRASRPRLSVRRPLLVALGVLAIAGVSLAAYVYLNRNSERQPDDPFARERPLGVRVNLLREDNQPFRYQRVLGDGKFTPLSTELAVRSPPGRPTLFALDNPRGQPVEFTVELRAVVQGDPGQNELGIFFGWQNHLADPLARPRFFAARLDTRPVLKDSHGRLYLGTWMFEDAKGDRGGLFEQSLRPMHQGRGWIALAKPPGNFDGWHQIRLRIEGQKFTIAVDKEPPQTFDVDWITTADAWLQPFVVDPRGALGIWVQNGMGYFRNAAIKGLPPTK